MTTAVHLPRRALRNLLRDGSTTGLRPGWVPARPPHVGAAMVAIIEGTVARSAKQFAEAFGITTVDALEHVRHVRAAYGDLPGDDHPGYDHLLYRIFEGDDR